MFDTVFLQIRAENRYTSFNVLYVDFKELFNDLGHIFPQKIDDFKV